MVRSPNLTSRPAATLVDVDGITKWYEGKRKRVQALAEMGFGVGRSSFLSILGPSGCGKSTLLRLLAGLDRPTSGTISVGGSPVTGPQTQFGIVFQSPVLLEWRTALENVLLQAVARKLDKDTSEARARELLASVGLAGFESTRPSQLSGGMQQRVAVCRALLHDPEVVLMDEPFGALDALTRDQMGVDLQRLWGQGNRTIVFVTHSITEAVFLSDRVLVMSQRPGRIILDLQIDLPRPRRLRIRETPQFGAYSQEILEALKRTGVIVEDD